MSEWFKLFLGIIDHERIAGADLSHLQRGTRETMREAMHGLFVRAIHDLQRSRSDTGLVKKAALWGPMDARRPIAEELARVGMLEDRGDEYYPRNYLEKNRSGKTIRGSMSSDAARQQTARNKQKQTNVTQESRVTHVGRCRDYAVTPVSVSDPDSFVSSLPDSLPDPELPPTPGSEPRKLSNDERYMGAYVRGIESGKHGPYEPPGTLADQGALNRALARFGRARDGSPLRGEALLGWVEDAASDFATDVVRLSKEDPRQVEFFSGFACKGLVRWLNIQELGKEARRVG